MANLLTDDERAEYQEIGVFVRHDDLVVLTASSFLLPALFAALAYAWLTSSNQLRTPLALGSLAVWLYWAAVTRRRGEFSATRLRRAYELECAANLHHHRRIDQADRRRNWWWRWQNIKSVETMGSLVLFIAWEWLIFSPKVPNLQLYIGFGAGILAATITHWLWPKPDKAMPCTEPGPIGNVIPPGQAPVSGSSPPAAASTTRA